MPKTESAIERNLLSTTNIVRFVFACLLLQFLMEVSEVGAGNGQSHESIHADVL